MWTYEFACSNPSSRYLEIVFRAAAEPSGITEIALPKWRPGRYELGNFAKNIGKLKIADENGKLLSFEKTSSHQWQIQSGKAKQVVVTYTYFASQADAGACWTDDTLMYINPVHCCFYVPGKLNTPCVLRLQIPEEWTVVSSMKVLLKRELKAADYHELVDSPFMAAAEIQHKKYTVGSTNFHIWLQGDCKPEWARIISDFKAFTEVQLGMMKSFPVKDYHFMVLLLPYAFYHGVEHTASTVLALGPGYKLMQKSMYDDLLGVASHELFHAWNVKTLRPRDFAVYDYAAENYSRLGWVYEGFTTYYGDLFLSRSGYFRKEEFLSELNSRLQRHMDSAGRLNQSVSDSSFDTWLDGYVPGVPHRKTSIYDEGSLIALMIDLYIRRACGGNFSLDDLFRQLYDEFSKDNLGYREQDVRVLAAALSDEFVNRIFDLHVRKTGTYLPMLQDLLESVGCYISEQPAQNSFERAFGFKVLNEGGVLKIAAVFPGSPAEKAGLAKDDELVHVNGYKIESDLHDKVSYALQGQNSIVLGLFSRRQFRILKLRKTEKHYYSRYVITMQSDCTKKQQQQRTQWLGA
jgi:predicted metalloprotease with PDZ domain